MDRIDFGTKETDIELSRYLRPVRRPWYETFLLYIESGIEIVGALLVLGYFVAVLIKLFG